MGGTTEMLLGVRKAAAQKLLFLPHAIRQMNRPQRMISAAEVRHVIEEGEIIEDYPEDPRGHSCLMLGFSVNGRVLHVICAPKEDYLAIITAYVPDGDRWAQGFRVRVKA
jgi:hypothetical protein